MWRLAAFVVACAAPLAVAAQERDRTDPPSGTVTVDIDALKVEIQGILDRYRIPGASIALVDRDRTIWAGGVGKADVAAGVDVTADHLFRIGPSTRAFIPCSGWACRSSCSSMPTP
ncbi:serine hydrolase [Candidatus Palauibacter sp.]|uniref:serine hydrolase n=1 Tax=Candidatus Palauibacter sp. TaxID=3101350 RepID=UPI003B02A55E